MFDFVKANKFFAIICAAVIVVAVALFFITGVNAAGDGATVLRYSFSSSDRAAVAKAVAAEAGAPATVYLIEKADGSAANEIKLVFETVISDEQAAKADAAVLTVDASAARLSKGVLKPVFDFDLVAFFVSIGIIAVSAFLFGLLRYRKIFGVKPAFLLLAVSLLSPLLAAAFVVNFRLYAYGGVYFGAAAVSLVSAVICGFCFEAVLSGKAAGTASPFSKDAVNASLSAFLYVLVLPALVIFAAMAAIGLLMILSGAVLAASAAFTVAAAVFSAVFVPVFVAAPMLAKK